MNRETAQKLLPVIQAFAEGKEVQVKYLSDPTAQWEDSASPIWANDCDYRIKTREPREWFIHTDANGVPYDYQGRFDMEPNAKIKVVEILPDETP